MNNVNLYCNLQIDRTDRPIAFIDADNIKKSFDNALKDRGISDEESKIFDFSYLLKMSGLERYYIFSAVSQNTSPPEWITEIRSQNNFIFKETVLKDSGKTRKQEGVDVLLTVKAMQFAFKNKLKRAVIFSDDGDFIPLVEALVDEGVNTSVVGFGNPDKSDVTRRLRDQSDAYFRITNIEIAKCINSEHRQIGSGFVSLRNQAFELFSYENPQGDENELYILGDNSAFVTDLEMRNYEVSGKRFKTPLGARMHLKLMGYTVKA